MTDQEIIISQKNPVTHSQIVEMCPHLPWMVALNRPYDKGEPYFTNRARLNDPEFVEDVENQTIFTYIYLANRNHKFLAQLLTNGKFTHFEDPTGFYLMKLLKIKAAKKRDLWKSSQLS